MLEIDFNLFDHNFCESTIYSNIQHPEYMNALSSLFITFIGLNGLRKPHLSILLCMCYSCLSINGILSYYYHYYNTIGYGLLDRMSMVLLALNTTYLFVNNIKKNIFIHLSITSYYTILLTTAGLHMENLFNTLFALFLFSTVIYMYYIEMMRVILNKNITRYGWKGVKYIIMSGIFWIVTELLCNDFVKYLFGHVWWHIFVSYGGYLVSIVPHYIYLSNMYPYDVILLHYDIFGIPYLEYNNIV